MTTGKTDPEHFDLPDQQTAGVMIEQNPDEFIPMLLIITLISNFKTLVPISLLATLLAHTIMYFTQGSFMLDICWGTIMVCLFLCSLYVIVKWFIKEYIID